MRDKAGDVRDKAGDVRDKSGDVRDQSGDVRDKLGDVRDESGDVMSPVQLAAVCLVVALTTLHARRLPHQKYIGPHPPTNATWERTGELKLLREVSSQLTRLEKHVDKLRYQNEVANKLLRRINTCTAGIGAQSRLAGGSGTGVQGRLAGGSGTGVQGRLAGGSGVWGWKIQVGLRGSRAGQKGPKSAQGGTLGLRCG